MYYINYCTGAGNERTDTLEEAKRIADEEAAYTQQHIIIEYAARIHSGRLFFSGRRRCATFCRYPTDTIAQGAIPICPHAPALLARSRVAVHSESRASPRPSHKAPQRSIIDFASPQYPYTPRPQNPAQDAPRRPQANVYNQPRLAHKQDGALL